MADERTYTVVGMTCGHCVGAVQDEVAALPGVSAAIADLESGRLVVRGEGLDNALISAAVDEAGYAVAP